MQPRLTGRMPLGREEVNLQRQVAPLGTPFTASTVISGTGAGWSDVLTTVVVVTQNVTGLTPGTPYHWRVRLLLAGVGMSAFGCGGGDTPPPPLPTEPPTLPPALPPAPTPTPSPPSNWFSERYGEAIARRARGLVNLSNSAEIEVLRDMTQCWDIEQLEQITQYVCTDVVLDSYFAAGINLQQLLLTSPVSENWQYPECAAHNAQAFGQYLQATGQLRSGDDFPYYQGEIIIGYPDWAHAAVVVQGGHDKSNVRLVQASYSQMVIEETTLLDWMSLGPGTYVWHGHPSAGELDRISP